jgi:hypothetical protein
MSKKTGKKAIDLGKIGENEVTTWNEQKNMDSLLKGKSRFGKEHNSVAIKTGSLSNLIVIDIENNLNNQPALFDLEKRGISLDTLTVTSGSGGLHKYYQWCDNLNSLTTTRAKLWGMDIDLRGDGGLIFAPYSHYTDLNRNMKVYQWVGCGDSGIPVLDQIKPCPPALIEYLAQEHEADSGNLSERDKEGISIDDLPAIVASEARERARHLEGNDRSLCLARFTTWCKAQRLSAEDTYHLAKSCTKLQERKHPYADFIRYWWTKAVVEVRNTTPINTTANSMNSKPNPLSSSVLAQILTCETESSEPISTCGCVRRGTVHQLFSDPGVGKTFTKLHSIGCRNQLYGQYELMDGVKTLFVEKDLSAADIEDEKSRLGWDDKKIQFYYPVNAANVLSKTNPDGLDAATLSTDLGWNTFIQIVESIKPDIVIMDSVFSLFETDISAQKTSGPLANKLRMFAKTYSLLLVLIHHPRKRTTIDKASKLPLTGDDAFGSQAWRAMLDAQIIAHAVDSVSSNEKKLRLTAGKIRGALSFSWRNVKITSVMDRDLSQPICKISYLVTYEIEKDICQDAADVDIKKYVIRRIAEGASKASIAREIGVSRTTIYNILGEDRTPVAIKAEEIRIERLKGKMEESMPPQEITLELTDEMFEVFR